MSAEQRVGMIQSDDLKYVIDVVTSRVITYNITVTPTVLSFFYFKSDNPTLEAAFEEIRIELVDKGYIPFIQEGGENVILVTHKPYQRYRGNQINLVLFFLTIASTIWVGSLFSRPYIPPGSSLILWSVIYGFVFFSAPLMLILGLHELGHYYVAKRYHVRASFPFFLPVPISIGTLGAFISIRDPIPDRKAMTEIGAAGPMVGFAVSVPMLFLADYFQGTFHAFSASNSLPVNFPMIYHLLGIALPHGHPIFPMVFAVWVGIFATAMNLFPVSQLDGGHVARGLLGRRSTIVGYVFVVFIIIISLQYPGWLFIVFFAILLGLNHPPPLNDYAKVANRDILIGVAVVIMFILSFTIIPIS